VILLIGEGDNERMSVSILQALQEKKIDVIWVDQNSIPVENTIFFKPENGKLTGEICFHNEVTIDIDLISGIYTRLSFLKTDLCLDQSQKQFLQTERAIAMDVWLEHTDAMVINPVKSQRSNGSKLFQSWIVSQYGFKIPQSLITTDPEAAKKFFNENKSAGVIYKSASGERSIVSRLTEDDFDRLESLRACPTLFQRFVPGIDIRIHTLASGKTFATEIISESSDYRYDADRAIRPVQIPDTLKERCVQITRDLGLYISGIDTRKTPNGDYYCFEVNPSPAFHWYEAQTGQPISEAVADLLIEGKEFVRKKIVKRRF
jgi:glutathione synthase/RimK-type ligase-like ATP-grasp enzyme